VTVLFALAVIAFILPRRWTAPLISLVQVLVPFQDATRTALDASFGGSEPAGEPIAAAEHEALLREKQALEHQVAALSVQISDLQIENSILKTIRSHGTDDQPIWTRGRLIPARVVSEDLLAWRDSRLTNAGTLRGVRPGAPVCSNCFDIERGRRDGLRDGMAVLLSEVLVGYVDSVGTHTSQVRLLSDPDTEMRVRTGRFVGDRFEPSELVFWLTGKGRGLTEIRDVRREDAENGAVRVGDVVLADPSASAAPAAMTIGRISQARTDRRNPLLCILTVKSTVDERSLRRVYVFDPGPEDEK
jgi:cell shape-determining protein MreC